MNFLSIEDELTYWKEKAYIASTDAKTARDELEEYRVSSQEFEAELEIQLEKSEKHNATLMTLNEKLRRELEGNKEQQLVLQNNCNKQITKLQDELSEVTCHRNKLVDYIRELEQLNDDLERTKREAVASLENFDLRLNEAVERNAMLEGELEEKEALKLSVQRLKEETRDFCQELLCKSRTSLNIREEQNNYFESSFSDQTPMPSRSRSAIGETSFLTSAARIANFNIVGDLLRKFAMVEKKLVEGQEQCQVKPKKLRLSHEFVDTPAEDIEHNL